MRLERRIRKVEAALATQEEKRAITMYELFALRATFIGFNSILSNASGAQHAEAKDRAMDRLASYLMAGEFPAEDSKEAIAILEDMFYEIDAARSARDQPAPIFS